MSKVSFNNFIQVAGVVDKNEAELLTFCGIHYLGFPLRLPVNREDLTEKQAKEIIKSLSPPNYGVIISYSSTALQAIELCDKVGGNIMQLHGPISYEELEKLKALNSNLSIIKSLVITNTNEEKLKQTIRSLEPIVDAFITDTYDPTTGASGATGKTHDWDISKRLVELSSKPVILAGGLTPKNVYEAIIHVKPSGVDVHSGVEDFTGRKNKQLVDKFLDEATKAFSEIKYENKRISG